MGGNAGPDLYVIGYTGTGELPDLYVNCLTCT
jgi:hypothetical protein